MWHDAVYPQRVDLEIVATVHDVAPDLLGWDALEQFRLSGNKQGRPWPVEAPIPLLATLPPVAGDSSAVEATKGLPRRLSAAERRAVELRAMSRARAYYEEEGYDVVDVSATSSYDLRCVRGSEVLKVEVKGLTGPATAIELTANEVALHRTEPHTALVVISSIVLSDDDPPVASGGVLMVRAPFDIDDAKLTPTSYRYDL